jgi:hypothetical protein
MIPKKNFNNSIEVLREFDKVKFIFIGNKQIMFNSSEFFFKKFN